MVRTQQSIPHTIHGSAGHRRHDRDHHQRARQRVCVCCSVATAWIGARWVAGLFPSIAEIEAHFNTILWLLELTAIGQGGR